MLHLPLDNFQNVVRDTVLVAIDLIIFNEQEEVLLGKRNNSPAKGYLFVPGGRVMKGERLEQALERISFAETRISLKKEQVVLFGVYDHIYDENYFEDPSFNTQYIVIACATKLAASDCFDHDEQHDSLNFIPVSKVLARGDVHTYTKNYFLQDCHNLFLSAKKWGQSVERRMS